MGDTVKSFNDQILKQSIDSSPTIVKEFIEAQKRVIANGQYINSEAVKKIKELSVSNKKLQDTIDDLRMNYIST